jgi:hypothetical protein
MKNKSNLSSPANISCEVDVINLDDWFIDQVNMKIKTPYSDMLIHIVKYLEDYVNWPQKNILLWEGCTRKEKYHKYPARIKDLAKENGILLDGRANGPAKAAYDFAGGIRLSRYSSTNTWYCNHLYSGKFPYFSKSDTIHAVNNPRHFTQSSGIILLHPISNAAFDEYPEFAWYLRTKAFLKFRYDPDKAFSNTNEYGFLDLKDFEIIEGNN